MREAAGLQLVEFARQHLARLVAVGAGLAVLLVVGAAAVAVVLLAAPPGPSGPGREDRSGSPALDAGTPASSATPRPAADTERGRGPDQAPPVAQVPAAVSGDAPVAPRPTREQAAAGTEADAPPRPDAADESVPVLLPPPGLQPAPTRFDLPAPTAAPEPSADNGLVTDAGVPTVETVTDPEGGISTEPLAE